MSELVASMEGSHMSSNMDSSKDHEYIGGPFDIDLEAITVRRTDADDCTILERTMDQTTQE